MVKKVLLDGAWEEYGVIGIRIEIKEPDITVLWRNSPVLTTKFKRVIKEDGIELSLEETKLRYENTTSYYANLVNVFYKDEKLQILEFFPITGHTTTILERCNNSRFGNNKIVDEILKEIEGKWTDEHGFFEIEIFKDQLIVNGRKVKIHVLHSNSISEDIAEYKIVNQDPSKMELFDFFKLEYNSGKLIGYEMICDAKPVKIQFHRN